MSSLIVLYIHILNCLWMRNLKKAFKLNLAKYIKMSSSDLQDWLYSNNNIIWELHTTLNDVWVCHRQTLLWQTDLRVWRGGGRRCDGGLMKSHAGIKSRRGGGGSGDEGKDIGDASVEEAAGRRQRWALLSARGGGGGWKQRPVIKWKKAQGSSSLQKITITLYDTQINGLFIQPEFKTEQIWVSSHHMLLWAAAAAGCWWESQWMKNLQHHPQSEERMRQVSPLWRSPRYLSVSVWTRGVWAEAC